MAAPVLLWCVAAVALLTTLSGATEMNKIENELQFQWSDNVKQYQALLDSIQQNGERLKNIQFKNIRSQENVSPGQNAHEEYTKFDCMVDSFHGRMHHYYHYRRNQRNQLQEFSDDESSDEEGRVTQRRVTPERVTQRRVTQRPADDLQGMSQDKTNALKPSIINAMPGLIILVFTLTILFLYMIRSRSKEQNVNHKD